MNFLILGSKKGFSIIELLVVMSITAFIVIGLLTNVLRSRVNLAETARIVVSDVRTAQANALASRQFEGKNRCGYGLYRVDSSSYYLYAGRDSSVSCGSRQFNASQETPVVINRTLDARLEVVNPQTGTECTNAGMTASNCPQFADIFFESPLGKIWIDNQSQPNNQNNNRSQILVRKRNAVCPSSDCIYICVYAFGRIEVRNDMCPRLTGI